MKTYALFSSTSKEPLQTYEGEEMVQNKDLCWHQLRGHLSY